MALARPNFYRLLELDPSVDDWTTIEARISAKRAEWSAARNQGHPKEKRAAQNALDRIREIEALLRDDGARHAEQEEARRLSERERGDKLLALDQRIDGLKKTSGVCTEELFQRLKKSFAECATVEEIKRRLASAGVVYVGDIQAASSAPTRERIDAVLASSIRNNLELLKIPSLYEFLDLVERSSLRALNERAEEVYKDVRLSGRTDAEASARSELAGICKTVFKDDPSKAKYDSYLSTEKMETLKDDLEDAGINKILGADELVHLLRLAAGLGVLEAKALEFIEDYASKRKWVIQHRDSRGPSITTRQCWSCGKFVEGASAHCSICGEALDIDCPTCGAKVARTDSACRDCGTTIGDAPLVKALLSEAKHHLERFEFPDALAAVSRALSYWPKWQPALDLQEEIQEKALRREQAFDALGEASRARRFVDATRLRAQFVKEFGNWNLEELSREIDSSLARASSECEEGDKAKRQGKNELALESYQRAATVCVDFAPALQALRDNPPPPPTDFRCIEGSSGNRLEWKASKVDPNVAFRVLRKTEGRPTTSTDGTILGEVVGTYLDDVDAPVGFALYYSVYSIRGTIPCRVPAVVGPYLRTAEVTDIESFAGDGEVTIRWQAPERCKRVEVWREDSPPATGSASSGVRLTVTGDLVRDAGLKNGKAYTFRIRCVFPSLDGGEKETSTTGSLITTTPVALPPPVLDFRAHREGKTVRLNWTPLPGITVQVRAASVAPGLAPRTVVALSKSDRLGHLVRGLGDGIAQVELPNPGQTHFTPLSVVGDAAVIGNTVVVTSIDPVSHVVGRRSGSTIVLTWDWPPGTAETAVCYSFDDYPMGPSLADGTTVVVTKQSYDSFRGYVIRDAEARKYFCSVFAKAGLGGAFGDPGLALIGSGRQIDVTYRVDVKRGMFKKEVSAAHVRIRHDERSALELPPVVAIGRQGAAPISSHDGTLLVTTHRLSVPTAGLDIPLPLPRTEGGMYVKLFFANPLDAADIRLLPESRDRLRI